jgi:hypothetical protein
MTQIHFIDNDNPRPVNKSSQNTTEYVLLIEAFDAGM